MSHAVMSFYSSYIEADEIQQLKEDCINRLESVRLEPVFHI